MASQETKTYLARSLRLQRLVRVALLVLFLGQLLTGGVRGAEGAADPYDTLHDVIMTRYGPDGKTYAENESSPALFTDSEFPFGDKTYKKFNAALDAFAALPQAKIKEYSDVKRALLQRHLWKLFDVTIRSRWIDSRTGKQRFGSLNHPNRRAALQPKIASLIQRLALTKAQILALPDPRAATVKSGEFAQRHDPADQLKPFLPADLYAKDSSWVCIGTDEAIPVDLHVERRKWRSAFYSFIRLPKGRAETLEYIEKKQIPVGTQVALIEQAFLISDQGELVLSPLIVSISLRAYLYVNGGTRDERPETTQCVAEFVMQPRQLMQGNAVMKALNPLEHRFEASEKFICQDTRDPFETGRIPRLTRLNSCMGCHRNSGKARVLTRGGGGSRLFASSPAAISKATSNEKRNHYTWKTLRENWQADSKKKGTQSSAWVDQPNLLVAHIDLTTREAEAADPYDVLYDVLMTRYGPDGKSYAENETSPALFDFSDFPFGDKTYKKLNPALDAFAELPLTKIEAYSDVKRALLQRHLWKIFDATFPDHRKRWAAHNPNSLIARRSMHSDRRAAVRPKIASLIRKLALTRAQIRALPNTMAATIKSGGYAQRHDPKDRFKPFLAADLYSKKSSWVCLGEVGTPIPADLHSEKLKWRSTFLQFMRLPGGRTETLKYVKRLQKRTEVFPVGTQFTLIEQAFLISDDGELILSPLIVSISLRAYLDVKLRAYNARSNAVQCVAEFVMQPRQLMKGNAVMNALGPRQHRIEAGTADPGGGALDPFETGEMPRERLKLCMSCHGQAGANSIRTVNFKSSPRLFLEEGSPDAISKLTSNKKRNHDTWKKLQGLWRADSAKRGKQSPAREVRPQRPLDNKEKPKARRPAATHGKPAKLVSARKPVRADDDSLTDPLPNRAIRRFGTARYRHGSNIVGLTVSSDDRFAVAFGTSHRLPSARICDLRDGRRLAKLAAHTDSLFSFKAVAFSPDGKTLATPSARELLSKLAKGEPNVLLT